MILELRRLLQENLPGKAAHKKMSPMDTDGYHQVPDSARIACVLALLYQKNDDWTICLIERKKKEKDKHSGQISFPGGQMEENDLDYESCALREANEEIGLITENVEVIGSMSPLYVFVSNFLVYPIVAHLKVEQQFLAQPTEVESILEVPMQTLLNVENRKLKNIHVRNTVLKDVPYYDLGNHSLWGATAMMMSELLDVLDKLRD